MKKKFLMVAAVLFSSHAFAQTDSSAKPLDEIIVTANRMEQKQSQTGKVVTVIGREVIEKSQGRTVAQVLNQQAGITINGALNNFGTVQTTYMRGANSGRTLILLDGIPVNDPSQINNEFDLNLFLINDVERIEVCRGAQSTLYGSDAVAGVINIITQKQNQNKPIEVKTTISNGNYSTFRGNVQVSGKVDKLSYQARFAGLTSTGFSAARDTTGTKNFDNDSYRGTTSSASVRYQLSEQLSLKSFIQYNRYRTGLDNGVFSDDKDFTQKSKNMNTGVGFTFKNKGVNLTGNYMYSESSRNFFNDSGSVSGFSKFSTDDYYGRNQFVELFASVSLAKGLTLLQGADYRFNNYNSQFFSISSFGPFRSNFSDTSMSQQSMYASLMYAGFNDKLTIEMGGRLNVNSRFGTNYTYTFNPSYTFTKNLRIFGSIATGFKAPSLYQLYSSAGNPDLQPEESINYEVGLQQQGKKIQHRLVYFYREIETGLDFNFVTFRYYNIPNQIVRGLEYEFNYALIKNVNITGNYTYLNGSDFIQSRETTKDTAYNYLLRRPAHNINLTIGYQATKNLFVSINSKYISKRFDVGGFRRPDVQLDGYFLLGAYAEYQLLSKLKLFVDAQNITNTQFFDVRGFNSIPFLVNGGITLRL
jgi:vitamin B12 transporter